MRPLAADSYPALPGSVETATTRSSVSIPGHRCYGFCVPEPGGICGAGVVDGGAVATGLVELSALRNAGTGRRRRGSGVRSGGHASVRQSVDKTAKNKDTDNCDERDCTSTPAVIRTGAVVGIVVRHSVSLRFETDQPPTSATVPGAAPLFGVLRG